MTETDIEIREKMVADCLKRLPEFINLQRNIAICQRKHDFVGMCRNQEAIKKLIEQERLRVQTVVTNMSEIATNMTEDEQSEFVVDLNMLYMLADMLDLTVMRINDAIKKSAVNTQFIEFAQIDQLGKACQEKVLGIIKLAGMKEFNLLLGDYSDEATYLVRNKVKALLRKNYEKNHIR